MELIYGVINGSFSLTSFTQHYACENYSDNVHCNILFIYLLHSILFYKILSVENSERDGNTRPLHLPLENLNAGQEATVRT